MTIQEALERTDALKPNQYTDKDKIRWLSDLDYTVKHEILDNHEGEEVTFSGYDESTAKTTELLVPAPYSDIYLKYLFAQIDFHNAEYTRYNNSMLMFTVGYEGYAAYYNRKYTPNQPNDIRI